MCFLADIGLIPDRLCNTDRFCLSKVCLCVTEQKSQQQLMLVFRDKPPIASHRDVISQSTRAME